MSRWHAPWTTAALQLGTDANSARRTGTPPPISDHIYYTVDTARIEAIAEDMFAEDGTAVAALG